MSEIFILYITQQIGSYPDEQQILLLEATARQQIIL